MTIFQKIRMEKFQASCPVMCQQVPCRSGRMVCTDPNRMVSIPMNVPKGISQIIITSQLFSNSTLTYHNLSRYGPEQISLRILRLTFTNLESVEPEAFSHLIALRTLDLSSNRLRVVEAGSFKGLSLESLVLDNNPGLDLQEKSLSGLVVSSLSLRSCLLRNISYQIIREVSGHLSKLFLSQNLIKVLDKKFELLFRRLDTVALDQNPLSCTCQMSWLAASVQGRDGAHHPGSQDKGGGGGGVPSAQCGGPEPLRGRSLASLNESSFLCSPPSVKGLDIYLYRNNSGLLLCEALNTLETLVRWRHKVFTLQKFYRYQDHAQNLGRSQIRIQGTAPLDQYTCYVHNSKGNVHVDVTIAWPTLSPGSSVHQEWPPPLSPRNKSSSSSSSSSRVRYLYPEIIQAQQPGQDQVQGAHEFQGAHDRFEALLLRKHFSLLDLMLSMTGTMLATALFCALCFCLICKKSSSPLSKMKECEPMTESAITSEVQMHNMSQGPSYQELKPSHLLDFRTQQILPLGNSHSNWSLKI